MAIVHRKNKDSTTYQVRIKDLGGQWYESRSFRNLTDAKKEELKLMDLKRMGTRATSDEAKNITLAQYWEIWSRENRSAVSDGWKITQDQMYRDFILPVLGNLKMIDIRAPQIGRLMSRAKELGLGDQTRKHVYSLVRKMFNDAVEYYEMLATNPVKARFHRPQVSERKRAFLVPKQAWKFLEFTRDHYLGPAIWLQTLAGLRPGEVQALKWKSLSFDPDQILICSAYNNKTSVLQDFPKQQDWAYAPMPPQLKEYLMTLPRDPDGFVAHGAKGGMLPYHTYLVALRRLCVDAGVLEVTPHELRHTCTEIYVQAGASAEDIRRLLNHSGFTATKHYIHRTDERLTSIAGKLELDNFSHNFSNRETKNVCNVFEGGEKVH